MASIVDIHTEHAETFSLLREYDTGESNIYVENLLDYLSELSEELSGVYKYTDNLPQLSYDIKEIISDIDRLEQDISVSISRDFKFISSPIIPMEEILKDMFAHLRYPKTLGEQIASIFSAAVLNHYFIDGNKRFACFLLIWLSYQNSFTILDDSGYAALAILTASQGNKEAAKNKLLTAYLLDLCNI